MNRSIEVRWIRGTAAGYTDVFPIDEFSRELTGDERAHLVRGPRGGKHTARFRLTVTNAEASLDYAAFVQWNERHGMDPGVMKLVFGNAGRTSVKSLWWDGQQVPPEDATVASAQGAQPTSPGELAVKVHRTQADVLLRPGQAEFRRALDLTYGSKCCISGCPVSMALEAAHIEPYRDEQSNTPSNGLLLRRDLHALFDAGHIAIEPGSKMVHLSSEASEWKEYSELHQRALCPPQSAFKANGPSLVGLEKRWRLFREAHGDGD